MRHLLILAAGLAVCLNASFLHASETTQRAMAQQKAQVLEQRASNEGGVQPPPPDVRLTRDGTRAIDPRGQAPLNDAVSCLARSIYWEAKGTNAREMEAVANVIMNRLGSDGFPTTLCGVVQEGSETGSCQFSWWCDGRPDEANELKEYATAREIARQALNGSLIDRTHGALFFHHRGITPSWASSFVQTAQTHEFRFYRPPG
ncbi:Cell Wall Hydrolase [Kushneria avicenniae]|uniref:Cell Wall Hydrolase n=1 Tax=Kushneria avicenniae TaxID=402385 RepID=A0A1I1N341_9GAMM|nr:cell wall hydrolase [Kushneria avicenniae]SFC88210.1 Cell Wall Hydrolase [Kushneria avicenniae]